MNNFMASMERKNDNSQTITEGCIMVKSMEKSAISSLAGGFNNVCACCPEEIAHTWQAKWTNSILRGSNVDDLSFQGLSKTSKSVRYISGTNVYYN